MSRKLTCAPDPPPICTPQGCMAPPIKCIATCDDPVNNGECVIVCCAAFGPEPVPTLSALGLGATVVLIAIVGLILHRNRK